MPYFLEEASIVSTEERRSLSNRSQFNIQRSCLSLIAARKLNQAAAVSTASLHILVESITMTLPNVRNSGLVQCTSTERDEHVIRITSITLCKKATKMWKSKKQERQKSRDGDIKVAYCNN